MKDIASMTSSHSGQGYDRASNGQIVVVISLDNVSSNRIRKSQQDALAKESISNQTGPRKRL